VKPLDIETMPMVGLDMPEPEAPKNYKDPEKIDKYKELARQKQVKAAALDPLYGQVCAVCVGDECRVVGDVGVETEHLLLVWAHREIASAMYVCTWNGTAFDIPFLYRRSVIYGIKPQFRMSEMLDQKNRIHKDLCKVWDRRGYDSLDSVSKIILGRTKKEVDYTLFHDMVLSGDGRDTIREYCRHDAKLTGDLYKAFCGILY